MSVQATTTVHIDAPPDQVWPWIADITKHAAWSPKAYRVEHRTGEPNGVGSTYHSIGFVPPNEADHANEVTITEVVPNTRFALEARDASGTFHNTFDLKASGSGTDVSFHIQFPQMKGIAAIMVPILFPLVGKADFRKRMQLLKQKVESAR